MCAPLLTLDSGHNLEALAGAKQRLVTTNVKAGEDASHLDEIVNTKEMKKICQNNNLPLDD